MCFVVKRFRVFQKNFVFMKSQNYYHGYALHCFFLHITHIFKYFQEGRVASVLHVCVSVFPGFQNGYHIS